MKVSDVPEVPRNKQVSLVHRSDRNMKRIGDVLAVKDAARYVPFREYRRFLANFILRKVAYQVQLRGTAGLGAAFQLAHDER